MFSTLSKRFRLQYSAFANIEDLVFNILQYLGKIYSKKRITAMLKEHKLSNTILFKFSGFVMHV